MLGESTGSGLEVDPNEACPENGCFQQNGNGSYPLSLRTYSRSLLQIGRYGIALLFATYKCLQDSKILILKKHVI